MPRIPVGKIGQAPCGHKGECLIGQFYQCLQGCESKSDDFPEIEFCHMCGRTDIDLDFELEPAYYMWNPDAQRVNRRCFSCGACWLRV